MQYNRLFFIGLLIQNKISQFSKFNSDRNKTDSHRFKPNSSTILTNEQFDPSQRLHRVDMANRHRGDKQKRRYDR